MTNISPDLNRLGDALEEVAAADLARSATRHTRRRKFLLVAAALAVAIPGLAFAATQLVSEEEVARSLPAGTRMLIGTDPTCTVVKPGVEYHCTLGKPIAQPETADLLGTVEPTVDETKHVNGGCRSLRSDGREWRCYLGQAAVEQKIVSADFLGEYMPVPGVG